MKKKGWKNTHTHTHMEQTNSTHPISWSSDTRDFTVFSPRVELGDPNGGCPSPEGRGGAKERDVVHAYMLVPTELGGTGQYQQIVKGDLQRDSPSGDGISPTSPAREADGRFLYPHGAKTE